MLLCEVTPDCRFTPFFGVATCSSPVYHDHTIADHPNVIYNVINKPKTQHDYKVEVALMWTKLNHRECLMNGKSYGYTKCERKWNWCSNSKCVTEYHTCIIIFIRNSDGILIALIGIVFPTTNHLQFVITHPSQSKNNECMSLFGRSEMSEM